MTKPLAMPAVTVALALTGALVPASTASAAAPEAAPAVPMAVPDRTVKVDVDGDGRKDTVKITTVSSERYKVAVTTAKGIKSSIKITSTIENDWGAEPYWGAAKLDKVKGYELLLATGGGDGYTSVVLTWRSNKIVKQAAPKARTTKYGWYAVGYPELGFGGYRFYTKDGKRYVQQYLLMNTGKKRWAGTIVTSRWKSGAWKKTSSKKVSLTKTQVKKYPGGFTGVKIVAKP